MSVYLQSFYTRDLIDETIKLTKVKYDGAEDVLHQVHIRARFLTATACGLVQSIHFFAMWAISSIVTMAILGTSQELEDYCDEAGALTCGSAVAAASAFAAVFNPASAEETAAKIVRHADDWFKKYIKDERDYFEKQIDDLRKEGALRATRYKQQSAPDKYFDPAVKRMRSELNQELYDCSKHYRKHPDERYNAMTECLKRLRDVSVRHAEELRSVPYTSEQIDQYQIDRANKKADEAARELYAYPREVWSERVESWGAKFDREAFAEKALQTYKATDVVKRLTHLVNHVKEAERKTRAYSRCERDIEVFVDEVKNKITRIEQPYLPWRIWRAFVGVIGTPGPLGWVDRTFDPPVHRK